MTSRHRFQCVNRNVLLIAAIVSLVMPVRGEDVSADAKRMYLVDGQVVDADSGDPIKSFRVLPGTPYRGDGNAVAVWQPHMIREMTDGVFRWPRTRGYKEMRFRVEADGFRPATTNWLGVGGPYMRLKVHLRRDPGIRVIVLTPEGSPATDATIAIGLPNRGIRLDGCRVDGVGEPESSRLSDQWRRPETVQTDADGQCVVPAESDPNATLCVVHPDGYLEMPFSKFTELASQAPLPLELKPWGRIRGKVLWKDKPGVGERVTATIHRQQGYPGIVSAYPSAIADSRGEYLLPYIPPGQVQVGHAVQLPEGTSLSPTAVVYEYPIFHVDVQAGQTVNVDIGGKGIEVIGKLAGVESFDDVTIAIQPPAPDVFAWVKFGNPGGGNDLRQGFAALRESEYAPLYFRGSLPVADDGSFRIEDVMTGNFNLIVSGSASASASFKATSFGQDPIDLGTIQVKPQPPAEAKVSEDG